jgi:hypothetical protein
MPDNIIVEEREEGVIWGSEVKKGSMSKKERLRWKIQAAAIVTISEAVAMKGKQ